MDRNGLGGCHYRDDVSSLSARRAWIEISGGVFARPLAAVALRKESVDRNVILLVVLLSSACRSPQGERG